MAKKEPKPKLPSTSGRRDKFITQSLAPVEDAYNDLRYIVMDELGDQVGILTYVIPGDALEIAKKRATSERSGSFIYRLVAVAEVEPVLVLPSSKVKVL